MFKTSAMSEKAVISPDSEPKESVSIKLLLFIISIAPKAKTSAEPVAYSTGSSRTISTPFKSAILVLKTLSKIAGSPL